MYNLLEYFLDVLAEKKCQMMFFYTALFSFICVAIFNVFFGIGCMDTAEHIQASYLVSQGQLPYKDFFEHHNPLLWYLFAPIAKLFFQDITIFVVAKGIGVIGCLIIIWLSYKINVRFFNDKNSARLSVLILLSVPYLWKKIASLRPDIFMEISFLCALYCFFAYLEKPTARKLALSYFLLALSFLFLQKIVLIGAVFLFFNIYLLYVKKIRLSDFVYALGIGLIPLALFGTFLITNGFFYDWFYYNFEFNMLMTKYYSGYISEYSALLPFMTLLSAIVILRYYTLQNMQACWVWLYAFSLISIGIFAPHPQYYLMYWVFASVLLGRILSQSTYFKYIYILLIILFCVALHLSIPSERKRESFDTYKKSLSYLWNSSLTSPDDFLSLTKPTHNVFLPNSSFYWFGFHNVVIIDLLSNLERNLDLKDSLESKKPRLISYPKNTLNMLNDMVIWDKSKYFIDRNAYILRKSQKHPEFISHLIVIDDDFWKIDHEWIEKHYEPIPETFLWKLKTSDL